MIINQSQFGYLIDYYKYASFLGKEYDVTYCCWDYGNIRLKNKDITIRYISRHGNVLNRNMRYISESLQIYRSDHFDVVLINYFRGCSLTSLFISKNKSILDIRTGAINATAWERRFRNGVLWIESLFFRQISIISFALGKKLRLNHRKLLELPLGAEMLNIGSKELSEIKLLYVGSFTLRRIEDTIYGVARFKKDHPGIKLSYIIIGFGIEHEDEKFRSIIQELNLQKDVTVKGYIHQDLLTPYYRWATIGVSYIPITSYYNYQPPTKTYEYLQAGMPVLATRTCAQTEIINEKNGVLIRDNPEAFADGLHSLFCRFHEFRSGTIQETVKEYTWENTYHKLRTIIENKIR
ncbi:MAG: glycosyltransferase family 4 protein [Bacteroidota bacterium]|nr:glycosyltransferase family 4 protein [Bacteroidota bacterium]